MSNKPSLPEYLTVFDYYPGMCLVNKSGVVTSKSPPVLDDAMRKLLNESN